MYKNKANVTYFLKLMVLLLKLKYLCLFYVIDASYPLTYEDIVVLSELLQLILFAKMPNELRSPGTYFYRSLNNTVEKMFGLLDWR